MFQSIMPQTKHHAFRDHNLLLNIKLKYIDKYSNLSNPN